jgi:hypothetical protein
MPYKRDLNCKKCKHELPQQWFLGVCWDCLDYWDRIKIQNTFEAIGDLSGEWDAWRPEEIYWEDKYDCEPVRREAA